MTAALWYAILLLLQIVQGDFGEIDVYHNSRLYMSVELSGTLRSGLLLADGEILGEYESSNRYRQVYTIFPTVEFPMELPVEFPVESPENSTGNGFSQPLSSVSQPSGSAGTEIDSLTGTETDSSAGTETDSSAGTATDSPAAAETDSYASGNILPFLIDFTPVLSNISLSEEGEELELSGRGGGSAKPNGGDSSGPWLLRRERNRISLSNPGMELIVIIHF